MTVMISQLFGKGEGRPGVGVPAGIQIPFPAFQDQLRGAGGGQPPAAEPLLRVHLDLDPVPVPGLGGSAGYDSAVLQDHDAKAEAAEAVIIRKL